MASSAPTSILLSLPSQDPNSFELVYSCRKCRGPIFRPQHLLEHEVGKHSFSYRRTAKDIAANDGDSGRAGHANHLTTSDSDDIGSVVPEDKSSASRACTSYFLQEALQWMKAASEDIEGKLVCPHGKCGARLGMLRWAGGQCSCGTWVNPAIQLNKSAMDERYYPKHDAQPAIYSAGQST